MKNSKRKLSAKDKEIEKLSKNSIVFGFKKNYRIITFRFALKELVKKHKEEGRKLLQDSCDRIKSNLNKRERILNKNLEKLGVKI